MSTKRVSIHAASMTIRATTAPATTRVIADALTAKEK